MADRFSSNGMEDMACVQPALMANRELKTLRFVSFTRNIVLAGSFLS